VAKEEIFRFTTDRTGNGYLPVNTPRELPLGNDDFLDKGDSIERRPDERPSRSN